MSGRVNIRNNGPKRSVAGFPLETGNHNLSAVEAGIMSASDPKAYAEMVSAYKPDALPEAPALVPEPVAGDVNGDGKVDGDDLSIVMTEFNKAKTPKKKAVRKEKEPKK